ncbi:MAG: hypothetical protein BIFFINMI_01214 [Phycisphaerae bacterium]|nr:hypothetical protein [Phycisphaerae bacterium]
MKGKAIAGLAVGTLLAVVSLAAFAGCEGRYSGSTMYDQSAPTAMRVAASEAQPDVNEPPRQAPDGQHNTEAYDRIYENPFLAARTNPLSTFSIDVDTASYSNVRRFLNGGSLPPPGAVRIEELVNYFDYAYDAPKADGDPFAVHVEMADCPWQAKHRLMRVGIKGRVIENDKRPTANLVFLLDVSGSMESPNKLPLVKRAMKLLVEQLKPTDRVAIVVYAGAAGLVLDSTPGDREGEILSAIEALSAGGSTNGGEGIALAYRVARDHLLSEGVNRVILCTDGDFNVGVSDQSQLVRMVETNAKSGVSLTVLGFGMGNYKDSTLEKLADKGNGNYGYIDNAAEARKMLVEQLTGTLVTIAKDVKIQIEFNPVRVGAYRLIGYENRMLRAEDFNDDTKDAGEIGAGHTVTALYEIVPAGAQEDLPGVDPLKYQQPTRPSAEATDGEWMTVKLRYKEPAGETSKKLWLTVSGPGGRLSQASGDFKFAASVAAFGMLLRNSEHKGNASWDLVSELAADGKGADAHGYRAEFIDLVKKARRLKG